MVVACQRGPECYSLQEKNELLGKWMGPPSLMRELLVEGLPAYRIWNEVWESKLLEPVVSLHDFMGKPKTWRCACRAARSVLGVLLRSC